MENQHKVDNPSSQDHGQAQPQPPKNGDQGEVVQPNPDEAGQSENGGNNTDMPLQADPAGTNHTPDNSSGNTISTTGDGNTTIQGVKGDATFNIYSSYGGEDKDEKQKRSKTDITYTVSKRLNAPNIRAEELGQYCRSLLEKRIMLVNCLDEKVLCGVQNAIVEDMIENGYDGNVHIRALSFDQPALVTEEPPTIQFIEQVKPDEQKMTIIFVENPDDHFIKSLQLRGNYHNKIIRLLEDNRMMVVCLLSVSEQEVGRKFKYLKQAYVYWHIPYLLPVLERNFDLATARELFEIIRNSQFYKDSDRSEAEFYQRLISESEQGDTHLEYFIRQVDQEVIHKDQNEFEALVTKFNQGNYLERIVIWTGAYFSRLTFREFEMVVYFLLGDKEEIRLEKQHSGEAPVTVREPYTEKWERESSELLEACQLEVGIQSDGIYAVSFIRPNTGRKIREYIEKRKFPFFQAALEKIRRSGLLFHFDLPRRIVLNVIRLTVEITKFEKDRYDKDWLLNLVMSLKQYRHEDENRLHQLYSYEQIIELINRITENEHIEKAFNARLAELIQEMFIQDPERFQPIVQQFITSLTNNNLADAALKIVLALAESMQRSPYFNAETRLKHILNQGKDLAVKRQTYAALFKTFEIEDLQLIIKEWLPDPGKVLEEKDHVQVFAVRFQLDFSIISILKFPKEKYGEYPLEHPLLGHLDQPDHHSTLLCKEILSWLFNDNMKVAIQAEFAPGQATDIRFFLRDLYYFSLNDKNIKSVSDYQLNLEELKPAYVVADIIENWFLILHGLDAACQMAEEKEKNIDSLIGIIYAFTNSDSRRDLTNYWDIKAYDVYGEAIYYNEQLIGYDTSEADLKRYRARIQLLETRRMLLRQLKNRFDLHVQKSENNG